MKCFETLAESGLGKKFISQWLPWLSLWCRRGRRGRGPGKNSLKIRRIRKGEKPCYKFHTWRSQDRIDRRIANQLENLSCIQNLLWSQRTSEYQFYTQEKRKTKKLKGALSCGIFIHNYYVRPCLTSEIWFSKIGILSIWVLVKAQANDGAVVHPIFPLILS